MGVADTIMNRVLCIAWVLLPAFSEAGLHPRSPLALGWTTGPELSASPSTPFEFSLYLHDDNEGLSKLKQHAISASTPSDPLYGAHLSYEQINTMTAPAKSAVNAISSWLTAELPVANISRDGNHFNVMSSLSDVSKLFATTFEVLVNNATSQTVIRATDYTLPEHIESHVAAVFGLHGLPLPTRKNVATRSSPAQVTPSVLTQTYGIGGVTINRSSKNSQAVAEFQGQTMASTDLSAFFSEYVKKYNKGQDDVVSKFVGDTDKQSGQTEASLDIQYIMGTAPGIKTEFWLENSMDFCGDLVTWSNLILTTADAPTVHSVSYGWQGDLKQLQCTDSKVTVVDGNFAKLAAKGVSIIFASGDSGSGQAPGSGKSAKLYPSWPASSPWVTAVGATRFVGQKVGSEEMASDQFGSGGGFSTMFTVADDAKWQSAAVAQYFKVAPQLPPASSFPKGGRATPDVSALGEGYMVQQNGHAEPVGGTSASAPLFAALVGLLNEDRAQNGGKPMGFLNPFIYANTDAFTDVTKGDNAIGRGEFKLQYGWNCTKGWDPVTGVGTPIFSKLLAASRGPSPPTPPTPPTPPPPPPPPTPPPPTPPTPVECTRAQLQDKCPRSQYKKSKKCLKCAKKVCHGPEHKKLRKDYCA